MHSGAHMAGGGGQATESKRRQIGSQSEYFKRKFWFSAVNKLL